MSATNPLSGNKSLLLTEVLQFLQRNSYTRASFERLIGIVPSANTFAELTDLVNSRPDVFRHASFGPRGGGLALVANYNFRDLLPPAEDTTPALNLADVTPVKEVTRVTPDDIQNEITQVHYLNLGQAIHAVDILNKSPTQVLPLSHGLVTLCIITLKNGFTVIGKSACVDPANYSQSIGETLARVEAERQIWPLLGFRLADARSKPEVKEEPPFFFSPVNDPPRMDGFTNPSSGELVHHSV